MQPLSKILNQIQTNASNTSRGVHLLAVSKTQPPEAIADLASQGQRAFGENYVQEAIAKQRELAHLKLEWHLIGHLQSNKAELAAQSFDWIQTIDRPKLVTALGRYRQDTGRAPLQVLIQVNIDAENSKHGCAPEAIPSLTAAIAQHPSLTLRGLMAIPKPYANPESRLPAFREMKKLFDRLAASHPHIDTLSMGMSDDFELAIAEGATLVRIGTALFGARPSSH